MRIPNRPVSLLLACVLGLGACTTTEAIQTGSKVAKVLLGVAEDNYADNAYFEAFSKLLDIVADPIGEYRSPYAEQGIGAGRTSLAAAELGPPPTVAIELEVDVIRERDATGAVAPHSLADGAVIRDGQGPGRTEPGDLLKVRISTNVDCHVWAFWVDATGWAYPVFPVSESYTYANPIPGGQEFESPPGSEWFWLDGYRGVETLYVLASHAPMPELDLLLSSLVHMERPPLDPDTVELVAEPDALTRGIGWTTTGAGGQVLTTSGATAAVPTMRFWAESVGADVMVQRWFVHE